MCHTLLQIILDFQRTFCIAMGPPIRTDTLQFAVIHNVEIEQDIQEKAIHKLRLTLFMVVLKGI